MKRVVLSILALVVAFSALAQQANQVVILYENDVHCAVQGYPIMAGLRDSMLRQGQAVAVVSAGDFSFGAPIGASSKGEYVMRMMNAVGYDAVCMGNHEFDYGMAQLRHLESMTSTPMLCCNYKPIGSTEPVFTPFVLRKIGGRVLGFVGVTTPTTISAASPTTFQNKRGDYIYHFSPTNLVTTIQQSVDAARAAGAEVVVLLTHLGDSDGRPNSVETVAQLSGVDLVLDGHDHHQVPDLNVMDKMGKAVHLSSTGTQFQTIGMATLTFDSNGLSQVYTRLVATDSLTRVGCISPRVADTLAVVQELFEAQGRAEITTAAFPLIAVENDIRVCRLRETNLGDLVADAYRYQLQADVAIVNGGCIRANVSPGSVTHNDLYAVLPFSNTPAVIRVKGQALLDALETAVREYPRAEGCFGQVSGVRFAIDTTIPSSVLLSAEGKFIGVGGARRVSDVFVGGNPLNLDATYTIAGPAYLLIDGGDGFNFPNAEVVQTSVFTDLMLLEQYLSSKNHSTIPEEYRNPQGRIVFK